MPNIRRKTKKRSKKLSKKIKTNRRKLVSPLLRTENDKKSGIPKIYVINLKKDKTKWNKYKGDYNKGLIDRYSACLGVDPQTKYKSQFKENPR